MLRLIKPDLASTGKPHLRNRSPSRFLHLRARNALVRERSHLGFQAVANKIKFVETLLGRVERDFRWRQREDQPTMPRIHGFEPEDVAEKCAVRLRVFTVDNHVSARNHLPSKYHGNS